MTSEPEAHGGPRGLPRVGGARRVRAGDVWRTLLAVGAILPGLLGGLSAWLRTGDRRAALNRTISLWGRLGTRAAGIDLRVRGAERLALRPAVFLLNHQSGIDPILVCALLEKNFVGVAKSEIRRNPLLGPAFRFVDTVFIDRGDRADAVRSLAGATEALGRGLAIAIAPEGTRSGGAAIGSFKKGAFRIARAARVPLVPIVIHDAGRILPRGGLIMRAGSVRVSVLAPRDTCDWSSASLDPYVEEVEAAYRTALARD